MAEQDIAVLAPLMKLIEDTVRGTPVHLGPGGTDDLSAKLTVRTAAWLGRHVLPRTPGLAAIVAEVDAERQRQDELWDEQNHPDGTGSGMQRDIARLAKEACQEAAARGEVTWRLIKDEEHCEALAESDPVRLRAELVQDVAVGVAWIAAIDRRLAEVPCTAVPLPLGSALVEPCIVLGRHEVHRNAAGTTWTDPEEPIQ